MGLGSRLPVSGALSLLTRDPGRRKRQAERQEEEKAGAREDRTWKEGTEGKREGGSWEKRV